MASWTQGRISLLGDAASCISFLGEGSSNAIVAAKTRSDSLAAHPSDHSGAFVSYETTNRRRLRRYHRLAPIMSHFLVPSSRLGIQLRDAGLRLTSVRQQSV